MSSHYFVKEGQEPALFIIEPLAHSLVEPLLEWAPYILVSENALAQVMSWGTRIDAVLSSGRDSLELNILREQQVFDLIYCQNPDDIILLGLQILKDKGQTAATITIREDPQIFLRINSSLSEISLALLSDTYRWVAVTESFEKWLPRNALYKIRKLTDNQELFLNGFHLEGDFLMAEKDGMATISSTQVVWLGETL